MQDTAKCSMIVPKSCKRKKCGMNYLYLLNILVFIL